MPNGNPECFGIVFYYWLWNFLYHYDVHLRADQSVLDVDSTWGSSVSFNIVELSSYDGWDR